MATKKITDLQLIGAITDSINFAVDNGIQTYRATMAQIRLFLVPPGTLMDYAGSTAPTGYLLCYGQAISRTTYSDLYAIIGTTYGVGDGSTTFNLPDLRGRGTAGKDDMGGSAASRITSGGSGVDGATLGAVGGSQSLSLSHTHTISHNHQIYEYTNGSTTGGVYNSAGTENTLGTATRTGGNQLAVFGGGGSDVVGEDLYTDNDSTASSSSLTGNTASMNPTMILNKIIKY